MTFSIVAFDDTTRSFAVITKHFAVGTSVPWIRGNIGAVATQAETNPLIGNAVLDCLESGMSASDALESVMSRDIRKSTRQVHCIGSAGEVAQWNGDATEPYSGSLSRGHVSVSGNMLTGPDVLSSMLDSYYENSHLPLIRRMFQALAAGERAGGDKRGPGQSAAILITSRDQPYPAWNIRVDNNTTGDIITELEGLVAEGEKDYVRNFYDNCPARFEDIPPLPNDK